MRKISRFRSGLNSRKTLIPASINNVSDPSVLATAGDLVFYGETNGGFAAVDAKPGETLWHFKANVQWKGSPMTYTAAGRQYVAMTAGSDILSFALPSN